MFRKNKRNELSGESGASKELTPPSSCSRSQRNFGDVEISCRPEVSQRLREYVHMLPKLTMRQNRSNSTRICIIGGSRSSVAAPVLTALAALESGADRITILTTSSASTSIKCQSPGFTVVPYIPEKGDENRITAVDFLKLVWPFVRDSHAICVGYGLGEDAVTLKAVTKLLKKAGKAKIPLILDGDGLSLLCNKDLFMEDLSGSHVLITPNEDEFVRL